MDIETTIGSSIWFITGLSLGGWVCQKSLTQKLKRWPFPKPSFFASFTPSPTPSPSSLNSEQSHPTDWSTCINQPGSPLPADFTLDASSARTSSMLEEKQTLNVDQLLKQLTSFFPQHGLTEHSFTHLQQAIWELHDRQDSNFYVNFALRYLMKGETHAAVAIFLDSRKSFLDPPHNDLKKAARDSCFLGALMLLQSPVQALSYYQEAIQFDESHDQAWLIAGYLYLQQEKIEHAHRAFLMTYKIGTKKASPEIQVEALKGLVLVQASQNHHQKVIQLCHQGIELNQPLNNKENLADFYGYIGKSKYATNQHATAAQCHKKSLHLNKSLHRTHAIGSNYFDLGQIFSQQKDWQKAIACYEKSLEIYTTHQNYEGMADNYFQLGQLYIQYYKTTGKAEKNTAPKNALLDSSTTTNRTNSSTHSSDHTSNNGSNHSSKHASNCSLNSASNSASNISSIHSISDTQPTNNALEKALHYHQQALRLERTINKNSRIAKQLFAFGHYYELSQNHPLCIQYFQHAYDYFQKEEEQQKKGTTLPQQAQTLERLGIVYQAMCDLSQAEQIFHKAIKLYEQLGDKEGTQHIKNRMSELALGNMLTHMM